MSRPITRGGFEKLREELARLKKVDRPAVIKDIAEARSHGDLSENAEYHAAKEKQSFIEGRIQEIGHNMATAEIIDSSRLTEEKVVFGTTVTLRYESTKEIKKYTLVGQDESDLKNGRISIASPVGKALIGHKVGEKLVITTPAKKINCEILNIAIE